MTLQQKEKAKPAQPVVSCLLFFLVLLLFVLRAALTQRSDVSPCTEAGRSDPPSSNTNAGNQRLILLGGLAKRDKNKMAERTRRGERSLRGPGLSRLSPGSHGDKASRYLPVLLFTETCFLWDARRKCGEESGSPAGARRK